MIYVAYTCIAIGFFYEIISFFVKRKNELRKEKNIKEKPEIAILIPARYESKVIERLLISIEKQTYSVKPKNVYVIVESESDKTVEIVKNHSMNYFVRKKLDLKTKGYALAELIEDLDKKKKYYDCYFIFDADNILDESFIENMLKDYKEGYAISTGYRALKNCDHYFPVSAGLTYYMINEIRNRGALKNNGSLLLSGTGYYIHGKYIKEWHTFPFHSLTEDYESSLYYALHGISTSYREDALFYDEQPESYKKSISQRSRWIKGYLTNWLKYRKLFKKELKNKPINPGSLTEMSIGILPALWIVVGLLLILINGILQVGIHFSLNLLIYLGIFLLFIYFILILFTAILLYLARKHMDLKLKVIIQTLFYHPFFLISYLHAFVIAVFKRNLGWDVITHGSSK